jgi:hypothetical protein
MSFAVSTLTAPFSWLSNENGAKLLVVLAAMIALFMAGRWISARSESSIHDSSLIQDTAPAVRPTKVEEPDDGTPNPDAPVHPEMDFGAVVLRKLYFSSFDAITGPADPSSFVDEVTVEVYFKQTGSLFENTYTVATPAGLGQLLRDKQWDSLYSPQIFIVNRYELKSIREAIVECLLDDFEAQEPPTASRGDDPLMA